MFGSIKEILDKCESDGREFWRVILEDDMSDRNVDENESAQKMRELMVQCIRRLRDMTAV